MTKYSIGIPKLISAKESVFLLFFRKRVSRRSLKSFSHSLRMRWYHATVQEPAHRLHRYNISHHLERRLALAVPGGEHATCLNSISVLEIGLSVRLATCVGDVSEPYIACISHTASAFRAIGMHTTAYLKRLARSGPIACSKGDLHVS